MRAQNLSRLQYIFLLCFVALLWAAAAMILLSPSAQSLQFANEQFYQVDDDCDGIPNFQDARFDMKAYNSCYRPHVVTADAK